MDPVPLVLYTRPGCHLCDEMKSELGRARPSRELVLSEVDIETDPELEERFGRSIPVLEIAGRVAFKGRLTAADFERKLERIAGEHA
jgi:glutaredoxin